MKFQERDFPNFWTGCDVKILLLALLITLPATQARALDYSIVLRGWLEHAYFPEFDLEMDAKLDTGAKTSAIGAEILSDPDATEGMVTFRLTNEEGEERTVEREIVRTVKIKKRGGGTESRIVVELELCLGIQRLKSEFSLSDRSNFNYPVLIGRRALSEAHIAVRADEEYVDDPDCD